MGAFDGQGHTISNLKVVKDVKDEGDAGGLFGYTSYAGITHFTLENVNGTAGADVTR